MWKLVYRNWDTTTDLYVKKDHIISGQIRHRQDRTGLERCMFEMQRRGERPQRNQVIDSLPGHRQILGKHRPSEGHIDILDSIPSPWEFWEKYAKDGTPVLFRGMADGFAGKQKWTDDYLMETYGHLRVKIEAKAEKEYYPEGDKGVGQDTLRHFLETYRTRNAYVVSQLPDPMSAEVSVPPFLTCGTFGQRLLEANLWFSSGGTKSLLHRDADNAINCLLFGTKDWIFIDPAHEPKIPIAKETESGYGGFAVLNPDSVDLERFPQFADVPWFYGNVTAGDCIFLPKGYWHQVRSYGSRNLAVSLLFSRLTEIDLSDCEGANLSYTPLSEMDMVFTYDGYGEQTMGDTDPFELNDTIKEWCVQTQSGLSAMDRQYIYTSLTEAYQELDNKGEEQSTNDADVLQDIADRVVGLLDINRDSLVSCAEVQGLKLATLKRLANIIDNDPANSEEYEYAKFTPQEIRNFATRLLERLEADGQAVTSRQDFVQAYRTLGGSGKIGHEIFTKISQKGEETVSIAHLQARTEDISALFSKKMKHHRADVRWEEEQENWRTESPKRVHGEL